MSSPALDPLWVCEALDRLIDDFEKITGIYRDAKRGTSEATIRYDAKVEAWVDATERLRNFKRKIL